MAIQYQLRVYSRTGTLQHIITDMLGFSYAKEVNAPGVLMVDLPSGHRAIADFQTDSQVEVWRTDAANGMGWYCDFYGFWRGENRIANSDGTSVYRGICPGQMCLLDRAIVAYPANTANRSAFTAQKAETICKSLVKYNCTGSGTTGDGRKRTVTLAGIVLEGDAGRGNTMDVNCAWQRLLPVLQDVATMGGGDFDLVKTSAAQWEFRWYPGQLGVDRTGSVIFALNFGNVANPILRRDFTNERTVAIVGGQGQDSGRTVVVRTGANYNATYNATEVFVDARQSTTTAALNQAGDVVLSDARTRNELTFDVLQVPQTLYGKHYFLGDLVTGIFEGFAAQKQVKQVTVAVGEDGSEQIQVELADV